MHLLQSGEPIEGITMWLGTAMLPNPDTAARRFRATDSLLELLKTL